MARSGNYKTYQHGNRSYTLENTFTKGMKYSDSPLQEGELRILNNVDLSNDKDALKPRKGLRMSTQIMAGSIPTTDNRCKLKYYDEKISKRALVEDSNGTLHFTIQNSSIFRTHTITNTCYSYAVDKIHDIPMYGLYNSRTRAACTKAYNHKYYVPRSSGGFYVYDDDISEHASDGVHPGTSYLRYIPETLNPRELNAAEAAAYGYNMLSTTPYSFSDTVLSGTDTSFLLDGILPYETVDSGTPTIIKFDPRVNERVTFRAFYEATAGTYYAIWCTKTADSDNYQFKKAERFTVTTTAPALMYTTSVPNSDLFIELMVWACVEVQSTPGGTGTSSTIYYNTTTKATWYWSAVEEAFIACDASVILNDVPVLQTIENSFSFSDVDTTSMRGMEFINYDLSTSVGLTYWAGSLVYYAPTNGKNILFLSAYNEPEFFPYPNNTDIFDENIRYCVTYLDQLLVFTETQLWALTKDTATAGWTKTLIQGNLHISDFDINFIQVVKNMVYFKSANNYFMVVPKSSSSTGELTLAPVSRTLDDLFQNFNEGIKDILISTYGKYERKSDTYLFADANYYILDAFNYLDYEDVHNVYKLRLSWNDSEGVEIASSVQTITVEILYNTVTRYWRCYTYEANYTLYPYTADATQATDLMTIIPYNATHRSIWLVERSDVRQDLLLTAEVSNFTSLDTTIPQFVTHYSNYQLLDTGYHDYILEAKKRFRELQFFINNLSTVNLNFNLGFILDNTTRIPLYTYTQTTETQNNTVVTYLTRSHELTEIVPNQLNYTANLFTLNQLSFPQVKLWKIRTGISGKGYAPRFQLLGTTQVDYEIINYIWVYRQMNLR